LLTAINTDGEVLQNAWRRSTCGYSNFRVELQPVDRLGAVGNSSVLGIFRDYHGMKSLGELRQLVAIIYLYSHGVFESSKETVNMAIERLRIENGITVFAISACDGVV
jgi:hypothetical protein